MSLNRDRIANQLLGEDEETYWHDGTATPGPWPPAIAVISAGDDAIPHTTVLIDPPEPHGAVARIDLRPAEALAFAYNLCSSALSIADTFEEEHGGGTTTTGHDPVPHAREAFLDLFRRHVPKF